MTHPRVEVGWAEWTELVAAVVASGDRETREKLARALEATRVVTGLATDVEVTSGSAITATIPMTYIPSTCYPNTSYPNSSASGGSATAYWFEPAPPPPEPRPTD